MKSNVLVHGTLITLTLIALVGCAPPPAPPDPALWGGLQPGPYRAGFGLKWETDPTRRDPATKAAYAIPVGVWYPALDSRAERMELGDYFDFRSTQKVFDAQAAALNAAVHQPANPNLRTAATRDAPPAKGPFPVIIYSPDDNYAESSVLCEFLATHGYVVLSAKGEDAARMRDMIFLLRLSGALAIADPSHAAAIGRGRGGDAVMAWGKERDTPLDAATTIDGLFPSATLDFLKARMKR
jgi:hypothetical protein